LKKVGDMFLKGNAYVTDLSIPPSCKTIGQEAFRGCTALTAVDIKDYTTDIMPSAFLDCGACYLSGGAEYIGSHLLRADRTLFEKISDGTTSISEKAFEGRTLSTV